MTPHRNRIFPGFGAAFVTLMASAAITHAALTAYHDFGATTGFESTGNITTHQSGGAGTSTNPLDTTPKELVRFSDGATTGIFFSVAGANGMDSRNGGQTGPPDAGTPADPLFNVAGLNLNNGMIFEGGNSGSGATTYSLTGLNPNRTYDVAVYGHRSASNDGVERFTLNEADFATNSSSTGALGPFTTDMNTRPNQTTGDVVRWTGIAPGADGAITFDVDPERTSPSNIAYLSALRLQEVDVAGPPVPTSGAFVAYHDLGATIGFESTGNITTHQSGPDGTSDNALVTQPRQLVRFADGGPTGAFFEVSGANGMDSRNGGQTGPPNAGTPADALFNVPGLDLTNGTIFEGGNSGSGATTFTFSGLDSELVYDLALYGDRAASNDGVERFTLDGADAATNISSVGIINTFVSDMNTRPNAAAGNVVRWTDIAPGADGMFTVTIDPEVTSPSNIAYLSAVRLEAIVPVPEPAAATLTLLGLACLMRRRRCHGDN